MIIKFTDFREYSIEVQVDFKPPNGTIILAPTIALDTSHYVSDERCGIDVEPSRKNEKKFPWLTEVFVKQKFKCFGNFISRTRAVTPSNCVNDGVQTNEIHLYIYTNRCK